MIPLGILPFGSGDAPRAQDYADFYRGPRLCYVYVNDKSAP